MKKSLFGEGLIIALCPLMIMNSTAAADPSKRHSTGREDQAGEQKYVYVTGSHIPQKIRFRSLGMDTPYNLRVYSQSEFLKTGRSNVGDALVTLDPSLQITHR